jgi:malonate transporter
MLGPLTNALAPIFLGLIVGYFAGKRKIVDTSNMDGLVVFTMSFALPCSLFMSIARTPRGELPQLKGIAVVLAATYLLVYALMYFVSRRSLRISRSDSAVTALTVGFPNVVAISLPLLSSIYGPSAAASAAISVAIGAVTVSPLTLAILQMEKDRQSPRERVNLLRVWASACARPVVWSPLLAMIFMFFSWHLPPVLERTLDAFGNATGASALFVTGIVVSSHSLRLNPGIFVAAGVKNLLQPVIALGISLLLHLPPDSLHHVVLIAAIPCGFFGLIFGKRYSASPESASSSLVVAYFASVFTLAITIALLARFS